MLTRSSGGEEGRDARASSTDPLGERPLRAQLNANLASEVLALEHLVVAQEGEHEARELPRLDEGREPALTFFAGVIGDGSQGVEGVAPALESRDERLCAAQTLAGLSLRRASRSVRGDIPATPQSPKPELRIVDPLLTSATASSADLNSFEPPRLRAAASVADHRGLHVLNARRGERGELLRVWTGAAGSWRTRRGARDGARARVRRA